MFRKLLALFQTNRLTVEQIEQQKDHDYIKSLVPKMFSKPPGPERSKILKESVRAIHDFETKYKKSYRTGEKLSADVINRNNEDKYIGEQLALSKSMDEADPRRQKILTEIQLLSKNRTAGSLAEKEAREQVRKLHAEVISEGKFKYFDDERRFQAIGDGHPLKLYPRPLPDVSLQKYSLNGDIEFWYDSPLQRISTSDPNFYIQILNHRQKDEGVTKLFVNVGKTKIQFGKAYGKDFEELYRRSERGNEVMLFEEIGWPLTYHTYFSDNQNHIVRPRDERMQLLTNAEFFESRSQQETAIAFVKTAVKQFGNLFYLKYRSFNPTSGSAVFTHELEEKLASGDFISAD